MKVRGDFLGPPRNTDKKTLIIKVSKSAKIRNRYNQVPHLTQDTNGKAPLDPLLLIAVCNVFASKYIGAMRRLVRNAFMLILGRLDLAILEYVEYAEYARTTVQNKQNWAPWSTPE